jgi:hypothetical protein
MPAIIVAMNEGQETIVQGFPSLQNRVVGGQSMFSDHLANFGFVLLDGGIYTFLCGPVVPADLRPDKSPERYRSV